MALRWEWNDCIGELEIKEQKYPIRIYQGNAYAIFLNEQKKTWTMHLFFADKKHFDNCRKDKEWNYAEGWMKITLWKVPSDLWTLLKDLHKRGVNIEIRSNKNDKTRNS